MAAHAGIHSDRLGMILPFNIWVFFAHRHGVVGHCADLVPPWRFPLKATNASYSPGSLRPPVHRSVQAGDLRLGVDATWATSPCRLGIPSIP